MSKLSTIIDTIQNTGDLTLLEFEIVNQGIDIHEPLEDMSLLGFVGELGNLKLVEILLTQGADPNFCLKEDPEFVTPLMAAVCGGNLEVVKVIVDAGADVNYVQEAGDYALALAASSGHQDIFDYLAPLTNSELRKQTEEELKEDLKTKTQKTSQSKLEREFFDKVMSLMWDFSQDYERTILDLQNMIEDGVNVNTLNENDETCLMRIAGTNHVEVTQILLDAGADPNYCPEGIPPLIDVAWKGGKRQLKMLLDAGADVDIRIKKNPKSQEQRCNPKFYGRTALMMSAGEKPYSNEEKMSYVNIVKTLIEASANVNLKDREGNTALNLAEKAGNTEIIKLLIEAGAKD